MENLPYRGRTLRIGYQIGATAAHGDLPATPLMISLSTDVPTSCRVTDRAGAACFTSAVEAVTHSFEGENGAAYDVQLTPAR